MAITHLLFTRAPVPLPTGQAALQITDLDGLPTTEDGAETVAANDGGSIIALTVEETTGETPSLVVASPLGLGAAAVTFTAEESGTVVTGQATVTVTMGPNGWLEAAWTSGAGVTVS